jgi:hypothetical protein
MEEDFVKEVKKILVNMFTKWLNEYFPVIFSKSIFTQCTMKVSVLYVLAILHSD